MDGPFYRRWGYLRFPLMVFYRPGLGFDGWGQVLLLVFC